MRLGMHIVSTAWDGGAERLGSTLTEAVEAAEAAGFDAISVTDHVWGSQYTGGAEASLVEGYTTLGFIAARTRRVRLLTLATAVPYRHAGLLAKIVTTLDVLSGGRAMLGIGAGDYAEEAEGLGLPFPPLGERYELLEEWRRSTSPIDQARSTTTRQKIQDVQLIWLSTPSTARPTPRVASESTTVATHST